MVGVVGADKHIADANVAGVVGEYVVAGIAQETAVGGGLVVARKYDCVEMLTGGRVEHDYLPFAIDTLREVEFPVLIGERPLVAAQFIVEIVGLL